MQKKGSREIKIPRTQQEINDFIEANIKMIHSIAQKYKSSGEYEDLFQEASIGFYKGILAYDNSRNTSLTTFCHKCAENNVKMALRRQRAKSRSGITLSYEDVYSLQGKDTPASQLSGTEIRSTDADSLHTPPDSIERTVEMREMACLALKYAKECLKEQEYKALLMRYDGKTQDAIAKELGISQATISKLVHFAHAKLRYFLNLNGYKYFEDED